MSFYVVFYKYFFLIQNYLYIFLKIRTVFFSYFCIPTYFVFLENAIIVSNIGPSNHSPSPKPSPLSNASASINLLATATNQSIIHPIIGTNNKIYSIEIEPSELYLVLYIKIEETLDYLELYAKIDFIITEAECNKHYKFENIFEGNRLYFRINYNKYSGRDFDIELNYQAEDGDSPFQVDLCGFTRYPNDSEVFEIKKGWEKNLYGKPKFLKNNNYVWKYSSRTYENVKYLSIQIEPKLNIENLDFYISSSKGFPEWAIIIISIAIVIIIAAICILILISEKGREFCGIFLCCCYLCGCLTRIIKK